MTKKVSDDAISYHAYDILEPTSPNFNKEKVKLDSNKTKTGTINEAYVSDYEYFDDRNYNTNPTKMNSSKIDLKDSRSYFDPRRSIRKLGSSRYTNFNTQSTDAVNRALHSRSRKPNNGKISKNSTIKNQPKLTRDQIEREFYEYTLECRKRLNEIFLNSPSSDTFAGSSTTDQAEIIETSSPKRGLINKKNSINNNYNSLKLKLKKPALSTVRTKKTETEQIWQI